MADPYTGGRFERTATGQLRWVPFSTEDARQAALQADRAAGANPFLSNLRNPVPVPLVTPAMDGLANITGALGAGAVNGLPNLGRMLFGGSAKPATPPPPPPPSSGPALSFTPQANALTPTSFRATTGANGTAPTLAGMESQVNSMQGGVAAPAGAAPDAWNVFINGLIPQESGGIPGREGPQTKWGKAQGLTQMLPATAKETAEKNGIPWQPERMRGTSPEDAEYQRNLGWLYFNEGLQKTGSLTGALKYYHGGPNERQWGPKTQTYAQEVMQRALNGGKLPGGSQVNSATGSTSGGPQFARMDPSAAMGMIPAAQLVTPVSLPAAPQMELPVARPQQLLIDKQTFLGPLAQAMEIPQRDRSRDAWERVSAMLGSAASAMVGQTDTSDMILAGGGAAQKGFQSERDAQRELDRVDENNRRAARTALAKAGLDVDLANLATQNTNLDRGWQDKIDTAQTKFGNLTANHQVAVQEIMANLGIRQFNAGAQNQNNMARAQVGLGAMESNLQSQNRSTELGWTSQQQRQQLVDQTQAKLALSGGITNTAGLLGAVGIPLEPVRGETPGVTNARATAGYVAAGNTAMAVNGLASEMVMTGSYAELLGEAEAKAVQKLIQQENVAGAAMIVGQTLNAALNGPEAAKVVTAIDELAARGGHPSAQIISAARTRSTEATQPK